MVVTVEKDETTMGEPALLLEHSRAITLQGRDRKGRAVVRIVGNYFPGNYRASQIFFPLPNHWPFPVTTDGPSPIRRAARALGGRAEEALRGYLRERVLPAIGDRDFVVVYMHSRVDRGGNFPGVAAIRGAYESLPADAKGRLRAVYFVHPALQSRLFFATFGRFLFSSGYCDDAAELLLPPRTDQSDPRGRGAEFFRHSCRLYEKLKYMSRLEYLWAHMYKAQMEVPDCVREHDEELERRPLMDYGIEATESRCVYDAASMDTSASMHSLRCIS